MKSAGINRRRRSNIKSSKPQRSFILKLVVAVLLAGLCLSYMILPTTTYGAGEPNIFAVTDGNVLIRFNGATPNVVTTIGPITGLQVGEQILGIDFRPATGELFGLGSANRLYTINISTAAATLRDVLTADPSDATAPFTTLSGTAFGVDFNAVPDLAGNPSLRVISNADQNLRINANNGLVTTDTDINPAAVTIAGSAYTNVDFDSATGTTLYGIDPGTDSLVLTANANVGTYSTVGSGLGIGNTTELIGFDIQTSSASVNTAWAALTTNGTSSSLYTINLTTGAATLVGSVGSTPTLVRGIAIVQDLTPPATFYAINSANNNLVRFTSAGPAAILSSIPITGLVGGDTIIALDFRPATGQLYGLGSGSRLYTIDTTTGAATQVGSDGAFSIAPGVGTGFDFNPVVDVIRFVNDFELNFRINPDTGARPGNANDSLLAYAAGDPNFGQNPDMAGAAYANNFFGATTTTLYDIDTNLNTLVRQGGVNVPPGTPSPNGGQLFTVGPLGIDPANFPNNGNLGFDILTPPNGTNLAFAAISTDATTSGLYSINLSTGAATLVGTIGGSTPLLIRALTAAPAGDFEFSAPTYSVGESGPVATITVNRLRGSEGLVTVTFSTTDGTATAPSDYTDSDQTLIFGPGETSQTVTVPINGDDFNEPNETINLALSNPTGGARLGAQSTAVLTITNDDVLQNANAYGVDLGNNLVRFNTAAPGTILSSIPITGLQPGETVLGIDFRPATGQLYALGSTSRLYVINPNGPSAVATQVGTGTFVIPLSGTSFGFDFNPTVDRIRVISDADQNLRLNPNDGTVVDFNTMTAGIQADLNLVYSGVDPNAAANPNAVGSAYTNSVNGATTTTLYDIDTNLDSLVIQNPPNNGVLNTVGPLGVDATDVLGFDMRGATNSAFATMVVGGTPRLYGINLATGAATLIGTIGPGGGTTLRAFALASEGFGDTMLVGTTATFGGSTACEVLIFDQSGGLLRHNRFSAGDPGFSSDFDFDPMTPGDQTLSATDPAVTIIVNAGACDDRITIGSATAPASGLATSFQINGQGGGDSLTVEDAADATARTVTINGATSTITGLSGTIIYGTLELVTVNAGTGGDTINLEGTQAAATSIFAGGGDDMVVFGDGATLSGGLLDGGTGTNKLDYSAYTTPVTVDLSASQTLFLALLTGAQEPGPLSSSPATGLLVGQLNAAQSDFTFNISYENLTGSPISGTHFHNQSAGVNGPIVRGLFAAEQNGLVTPSGTFSGVWSNSDPTLDPPASDAPIRPLNAPSPVTPGSTLVQELLAGRIYFNLHTLPNFPSGEIRGQVISQGSVSPATGTGGVRSFDNVTGGSEGDGLTGNANVNILRGGPGNDTLTGGQGGDQIFGDAGNDLLVWNNGDGSDFMEGGPDGDTVQVNGSPSGGDQFLLQVNPADPTRLRFDRTNLGLFNLNIGTTEALDFNTLGGDDTTTVEFAGGNPIPAGVSGGPGIDFDGGTGINRLVLQRSAGSFVAAAETYTATGPDSGDITVDSGLIRFSNLTPVDDTIPATNFTFNASSGSTLINVVNGPLVSLIPTTQINDGGSGSFELINFANKTNVSINAGNGPQIINVDNLATPTGLSTLSLNGQDGNDTFNVKASATVTINVAGGLPVSAPGDALNYDAEGRTISGDTTPPDGSITSPGVQPVNFTGIEGVNSLNAPLTIDDVTIVEGDSGSVNAVFTVSLQSANSLTVTVEYFTSNGTATAPSDYQTANGILTFNPGQTTRTISVPVHGDTMAEGDETFFVNLSNPTNASLTDTQGQGTITNDDAGGGDIEFTSANFTVGESDGSLQITANRTGDTSQAASVNYTTSDNSDPNALIPCSTVNGTAISRCDFTTAAGTLDFAAGETTKTFTVLITQDSYVEGSESFTIALSNPTNGAILGGIQTTIVQITDDAVETATNAIDDTSNFVRQHYHDFLNRQPDAAGFAFWVDNINKCNDPARRPAGQTLAQCIDKQRESTSSAFFLSPEFQFTGGFVYQFYRGSLTGAPNYDSSGTGRYPLYLEFIRDAREVSEGIIVGGQLSAAVLEANRARFAEEFTQRAEFLAIYGALNNAQYVDKLFEMTGITPTAAERQALIDGLINMAETRATVLRKIVDGTVVISEGNVQFTTRYGRLFLEQEFRRKFVFMQYVGYLRRNPDQAGFVFWLGKLNDFNGDFFKAEMVRAFIISPEYRSRFGPQ